MVTAVAALVLSYLIGAIPSSYLIARAKGVDYIVSKPFRLDQLRRIVRKAASAKSGS